MSVLGKIIYEKRISQNLTQDQFGDLFGVSGPAIFKFEKSFVNPSFKLWIKMAKSFDLDEATACLLWAQAKLPVEFADLIQTKGGRAIKGKRAKDILGDETNYARIVNRDRLRSAIKGDKLLPTGLKRMLLDGEIWDIYKPTGREIQLLKEFYGRYGDGTKGKYREALRTLRDFSGHDE